MNDLTILEHRFFSHAYAHDPSEKRLERLECLVFGSTRDGANKDRMSRLMKAVAARSQQPLAQEKGPASVSPAQTADAEKPGTKPPASSKQYPILNTLEWKALKKTYPDESLDQRLDRLESKMFGQPAQTMAYIDRVERLKKTVGIGLTPESSNDGVVGIGPKPKAQGRAEGELGGIVPMPMQGMVPPQVQGLMPQMNNVLPGFGFDDTNFGGMQRMIQQMAEMQQRQMQNGTPLGAPGSSFSFSKTLMWDPKTNQWIEQDSHGGPGTTPGKPGTTPGTQMVKPPISMPEMPSPHMKEIPGYADPNSI
jgi:hypothetical protein